MAAVTPEEIKLAWKKVKKMEVIPDPPGPKLPPFHAKTPMRTRLIAIQNFITAFEYNYTGTQYFDVNKKRSFKSIVSTAKDILNEVLPIQCLEAVFVAGYLTAGLQDLDRFPISFRSVAGTSTHRHIVLAVRHQQNKWGALGLSRSDKLMYKELRFHSLSELVLDFCREFENLCHSVVKVYVGFPFSHDIHSSEKVEWRVLNLPLDGENWAEVAQHFDTFTKEASDIVTYKKSKGALPDSFQAKFPLNEPESEPGKKSPEKRIHASSSSFQFAAATGLLGADEDEQDGSVDGEDPEKDESKNSKAPPFCPILVAPDELVFKPAMANATQVLPTNVFLQNVTASAYLVEVLDRSGLLEIVAQGGVASVAASLTTGQQLDEEGDFRNEKTTFRVSAKGMTVIAIKFNPPTNCSECKDAEADKLVPLSPSRVSSKGKATRSSQATKLAKAAAMNPKEVVRPHVVSFRCIRLPGSGKEEQTNDTPEHDGYVHDLPFVIVTAPA